MKTSRRMQIWRHNSFLGQTRMAEVNLQNMRTSPTLTPQARAIIEQTLPLLARLFIELQIRSDSK